MNKIIMKDPWNMDYIAAVLSDLLSRENDMEITVKFTPKEKQEV